MRRSGFFLFILASSGLFAQHSYTPADIEEGGRLFRVNCVACHGPEGDQVSGVDLGHGKFVRETSEDALIKIIQDGIKGTAMPPNPFSEFQAGTIVAYLRSFGDVGTASGKGDATRGKTIFETKGGCIGCHRVKGSGSRLGPDLTEIGGIRRAAELERAILQPARDVAAANRAYRVTTKAGETTTGKLLNLDTFTIQILDSKERLMSFNRANLRESGFVNNPMPSYQGKLSPQEVADIVAYLAAQKGY